MSDYHFYHPIEVRYGDLDPQGHVNNAKHLTYFEQARVAYMIELGLFTKDQSFMSIGVIIAPYPPDDLPAMPRWDALASVGYRWSTNPTTSSQRYVW